IDDEKRLELCLNQVWIGSYKLRANLVCFGRRDRENSNRQAIHNKVANNVSTMTGATTVHRNARLKSYADAVRYSEDGNPQKMITKQLMHNQYG
ncbi:hypothetical protein Ancab_028312, partial [Ancistrocladus abbreviatus]